MINKDIKYLIDIVKWRNNEKRNDLLKNELKKVVVKESEMRSKKGVVYKT